MIETANPVLGKGYSISDGTLEFWSGGNIVEAERQFEQAGDEAQHYF